MGTRLSFRDLFKSVKDHPHAYGDKTVFLPAQYQKWGSSPRVWGQVDRDFTVDLSDRIIPTRMGTR